MKILVGYIPLPSAKGVPLLSQNRQFQWFTHPTYIYPVVPAWAATLARDAGHEVVWADGIAEGWSYPEFEKRYRSFQPDLFLLETKTPVVKATWQAIDRLKAVHPAGKIAVCGDHVTALPEETLRACRADFILRGGDYDFLLRELAAALENDAPLPAGIHRREGDAIVSTGEFSLDHDLNQLPLIDRELTRWKLYSRANGNFLRLPGTYTMAGRDCWWGRCAFCSWTTLYNRWRARSPEHVLDEIGHLIERYPIREIFDDTGCFPAGQWLRTFCQGMIERGYHKKVTLGCNMIPGVLTRELYELMAEAHFRFVLFGLESAEQSTLDRIQKCGRAHDLEKSLHMATKAGLRPHVTCMVGYPWETRAQAHKTIDLTRSLFKRGDIASLQATIVIPYPGTPLFDECKRNGWLKTEDWDRYDMREPVMRSPIPDDELLSLTRGIYRSFMTPRFILRQIARIKTRDDLIYLLRAAWKLLGHLLDFRSHPSRKRERSGSPPSD